MKFEDIKPKQIYKVIESQGFNLINLYKIPKIGFIHTMYKDQEFMVLDTCIEYFGDANLTIKDYYIKVILLNHEILGWASVYNGIWTSNFNFYIDEEDPIRYGLIELVNPETQ